MEEEQNEKKRRRGKSEVWKHFTDSGQGDGKVICNHCGGEFDGSSTKGTTHLRNHLESMKCRAKRNGYKSTKSRDLATPLVMNEKSSSVIDLINNSFDAFHKIFDEEGDPIEHWDPSVLKSREAEILQVYKEEKEKFGEFLNKLSCRFTLEIISAMDWDRRILMVHYIDDSWKHQMRIISQWLDDENDIEEMKESCLAWKIDTNICSVLDWFPDDDEDIESWFCERGSLPFAGFVPDVEEFIDNILTNCNWEMIKIDGLRECVHYGYQTPSNKHKLRCAVDSAWKMGKDVIYEDGPPQRFYAPYEYLKRAVGLKEALRELEKIDPDFISINLTKQKWNEATATFEHLEALEEICESLRRGKKPLTIKVADILKLLRCNRSEDCHVCKNASPHIQKFFNKSKVFFVLTILDPRFKMDTIERCHEEIYGSDAAIGYLEKTIEYFRDIYNEYARNSINYDYKMLDAMGRRASTSSTKSELDHYLHELKVRPVKEFDILAWWHGNAPVYPKLARMARDYLAMSFQRVRINSSFEYEIYSIMLYFGIDDDIVPALMYLRGLLYY